MLTTSWSRRLLPVFLLFLLFLVLVLVLFLVDVNQDRGLVTDGEE